MRVLYILLVKYMQKIAYIKNFTSVIRSTKPTLQFAIWDSYTQGPRFFFKNNETTDMEVSIFYIYKLVQAHQEQNKKLCPVRIAASVYCRTTEKCIYLIVCKICLQHYLWKIDDLRRRIHYRSLNIKQKKYKNKT